ncbi:DUF4232 domain-containing protein [Streptomyces sp. NPDC050610]|uniref:DUF4232 domain-containing protein n=1 Tax=Streptomyces sp. NPDC050610 TaxID=3157097 RepID=UPI00343DE665
MAKSRRTRTIAVAVAAFAAAVSLTACQSGGTDKAAPAGASATASAASGGSVNDPKADSAPGHSEKNTGATARLGGKSGAVSKSGGGDQGPVELACSGDNVEVTAETPTRPSHYLLLTATNTGSQACNAYYYPMLRFGEDQSVSAAPMEDTKPQAVVTLRPGESAYAGVALGADGDHGRTADSLAVYFGNADNDGSTGSAAHPALPGGSAYYDDNAQVTYWQREKADAVN